jgi:hypothetical protein
MWTLEDKLGSALFFAGWLLIAATAPLVVVPMIGLLGIAATALGLVILVTGLLVVRSAQAATVHPAVSVVGGMLLLMVALAVALGLYDALEAASRVIIAQQRGQSYTVLPETFTRLGIAVAVATALTIGGLILRARWSPLRASVMGVVVAILPPLVATLVGVLARAGVSLTS